MGSAELIPEAIYNPDPYSALFALELIEAETTVETCDYGTTGSVPGMNDTVMLTIVRVRVDTVMTWYTIESNNMTRTLLGTTTITGLSPAPCPSSAPNVGNSYTRRTRRSEPNTAEIARLVEAIFSELLQSDHSAYLVTPTPTPTPTPTATPLPTLSPDEISQHMSRFDGIHNDTWTPLEQTFDGVIMVLVPSGCYMMGSDTGRDNEQPIHEQCFDQPFWIDKYEVTNEQYGGAGCSYDTDYAAPNQPRICISWHTAAAYCEDRNGRLPTEAQWEYAARGPEAWIYPWGNEFDANNVVYRENSSKKGIASLTAPVGSRPGGASWVGAMDMSGNVEEWTSSYDEPYPYSSANEPTEFFGTKWIISRGGSISSNGVGADELLSSFRYGSRPDWSSLHHRGFRCVRPASVSINGTIAMPEVTAEPADD